jgi:hypothetical protein
VSATSGQAGGGARQPVEQRAADRDGLIAVGADGRDHGWIVVAQPLRGQVDAMIQEGGEQGMSLGDERGFLAGSVAGRGPQQRGQGRTGVLDGRVEMTAAQRRVAGGLAPARPPPRINQVTAGSVRVKLGRHLGPEHHGHHGRDELSAARAADGPELGPVSRAW